MLHKKRKPKTGGTLETMIGSGTTVKGDVAFEGGVRVDGTVEGTVSAPDGSGSRLVISDQAFIDGEVKVPNVIINGRIKGNVHASERLELHARARVEGDLFYEVIKMEEGAEIRGTCSQVSVTKGGKGSEASGSAGSRRSGSAPEGSGKGPAKTPEADDSSGGPAAESESSTKAG